MADKPSITMKHKGAKNHIEVMPGSVNEMKNKDWEVVEAAPSTGKKRGSS